MNEREAGGKVELADRAAVIRRARAYLASADSSCSAIAIAGLPLGGQPLRPQLPFPAASYERLPYHLYVMADLPGTLTLNDWLPHWTLTLRAALDEL